MRESKLANIASLSQSALTIAPGTTRYGHGTRSPTPRNLHLTGLNLGFRQAFFEGSTEPNNRRLT